MTAAAITVNTIVIEVPMLNAAPLLRSRSSVRNPSSSRIGGRLASARTTITLVVTSRASTVRATPMTTESFRPPGAAAGVSPASRAVPGPVSISTSSSGARAGSPGRSASSAVSGVLRAACTSRRVPRAGTPSGVPCLLAGRRNHTPHMFPHRYG